MRIGRMRSSAGISVSWVTIVFLSWAGGGTVVTVFDGSEDRCQCCGEVLWRLLPGFFACLGCDGLPWWPRFARPVLFDQDAE